MLGTLVNCIAIILGTLIGVLLKGGLKENYKEIVLNALGLSVIFVGASGALTNLAKEDANPLLFIICLAIGSLMGEWIGIEKRLEGIGALLERKLSNTSNLSQGFVTASLIFCVGTMAVLGSIDSGIKGDHTTLYIKSILDGVMSIVLASSMGFGVMLSVITVLLYQGSITLFASTLQPILTDDILREMSIIGGILITVIGLNMLQITKIKVGNMLPAVFLPVAYYWIITIFS